MRFLIILLWVVYGGLYYGLSRFARPSFFYENPYIYLGVVFFVCALCLFLTYKRYKKKTKKEKRKPSVSIKEFFRKNKWFLILVFFAILSLLGIYYLSSLSYFYISLFIALPLLFLFPGIFSRFLLLTDKKFLTVVFFLILFVSALSLYHLHFQSLDYWAPISIFYSSAFFFLYGVFSNSKLSHILWLAVMSVSIYEMIVLDLHMYVYPLLAIYILWVHKISQIMYEVNCKKLIFLSLTGFILSFWLIFYNFPSNFFHFLLFTFLQIIGLGYTFFVLTQKNIYAIISRKFFRSPKR